MGWQKSTNALQTRCVGVPVFSTKLHSFCYYLALVSLSFCYVDDAVKLSLLKFIGRLIISELGTYTWTILKDKLM